MYYSYLVNVPANTTEQHPVVTTAKLTGGVIHRVEVQFPAGCADLARCAIDHDGHQYLPSNPEGSFGSDDYSIPIDEYYELRPDHSTLQLRMWNADDTYDHEITVRIGVLGVEAVNPFAGITVTLRKFLRLVGVGG